MTLRATIALVLLELLAACGTTTPSRDPLDTPPPPPEERPSTDRTPATTGGLVEFRDNVCRQSYDCPHPGNCPSPRPVPCPEELLPTQPPDTTLDRHDDGTCWVECAPGACGAPGPLRVRCPAAGAPAPTLATAIRVPAATKLRADTGVVFRREDGSCDLVECAEGTACATPPGRTYTNVSCPPELTARTAPGIVPTATPDGCFYGTARVVCPTPVRTWR